MSKLRVAFYARERSCNGSEENFLILLSAQTLRMHIVDATAVVAFELFLSPIKSIEIDVDVRHKTQDTGHNNS